MKKRAKPYVKIIGFCCVFLLLCFILISVRDCKGYQTPENPSSDIIYIDTPKPIDNDNDDDEISEYYGGFSVNFLNVGNGDAIFINFGDGVTMLIDCAEKSALNYKTITRYLNDYAKNGLDYLILTHPDNDHVGNAADILDNYSVKHAFIPYILQPENFSAYYKAYLKLKEKESAGETVIEYSAVFGSVFGEDYCMIMLSPNPKDTPDSAYDIFNSYENPPETARNNISPIIYLEYNGVKFVFTGDAGFSQENIALNNFDVGLINKFLKNKGKPPIDLADIDFLKVSHHGADDASGYDFLNALTPKNAVISVGGDNNYGHPKKETLNRIYTANPDCNFYLTSVQGTVSVFVDGNGIVTVKTDADAMGKAA